jgi:hypothetical protein
MPIVTPALAVIAAIVLGALLFAAVAVAHRTLVRKQKALRARELHPEFDEFNEKYEP